MSPEDTRKHNDRQQNKHGLKRTLEGIIDRMREELDELAKGLRPQQPQPVPIPLPARRVRRR